MIRTLFRNSTGKFIYRRFLPWRYQGEPKWLLGPFDGAGTFLPSEKDWNGRMSGIDERRAWSYGPRISEAAPHGFKHIAIQFLFGIIGVALITVAAIQFHLPRVPPTTFVGPGTISLLYLIVIAYVSLKLVLFPQSRSP